MVPRRPGPPTGGEPQFRAFFVLHRKFHVFSRLWVLSWNLGGFLGGFEAQGVQHALLGGPEGHLVRAPAARVLSLGSGSIPAPPTPNSSAASSGGCDHFGGRVAVGFRSKQFVRASTD